MTSLNIRFAVATAALLLAGAARAGTADATSYPVPKAPPAPASAPSLDFSGAAAAQALTEAALKLPDDERGVALSQKAPSFPSTVDARDRR